MDQLIYNNIIDKVPPTCVYIKDFITKVEEDYLMKCVSQSPKPKWTQLSNRRLQNWGGLPHPKGMFPEPIPEWLAVYCRKISDLRVFGDKSANHVLVNEYLAGQGIMPHVDGDLYYPMISTINLGSHAVIKFYTHIDSTYNHTEQETAAVNGGHVITSLLLEPGSLLLLSEDMYTKYLHGIDSTTDDLITSHIANLDSCPTVSVGDVLHRSTRISLTIRYVPKLLNAKLFNKFWTR